MVTIDHRSHDHASEDGGKIEYHDGQGSFDAAGSETSGVSWEIDCRKEIAHRLENISGFVDQECGI